MDTTNGLDIEPGTKAGKVLSTDNAKAIMDAFSALRAVMKKAGMDEMDDDMKSVELAIAAKCGDMDMPMVMLPPAPFGGATSFAQAVAFMAAQKQAGAVEDLTSIFRQLQDNILGDDDLGAEEKAGAITALSAEYAGRLQNPVDGDPYYNGNKSLSFGQRVLSLFGVKKRLPDTPDAIADAITIGATDPAEGALSVFQDKAGTWRWLGIWTNDRKDREGERFPAEAHRDFVDWSDRTGKLPELWGWHTPGSRAGVAEMVDYHDGFMIAAGPFDPEMTDVATKLAGMKDVAMSHGYLYRPSEKVGGEFSRYRTFEISYLPRDKAANEGTAFLVGKEGQMNATKEQWLRQVYGDERVEAMKTKIVDFQKSLGDGDGATVVGVKDVMDALLDPTGAAPAAANKSDPAPGATPASPAADATAAPASDQAPTPAPAGPSAEGLKALSDVISAAVKEATEPLSTQVGALAGIPDRLSKIEADMAQHGQQLTALKEADDAKIAAAFAPRAKPTSAFPSATDSEGNLKDAKDGKAAKDALGDPEGDPIIPYVQLARHAPALAE
jgi:hypothetical protein